MTQRAPDATPRPTVTHLVVVVPARNEQERLPRCLRALQDAVGQLLQQRPLVVRVVVVLDRCTDGTHGIAAGWPGVDVVVSGHGRVGAARALGIRHAVAAVGGPSPAVWIACTDADSVVPADWLLTHLWHADRGADLVLGTVRPDPAELSDTAMKGWLDRHVLTDGHPHVHGANLGVRADIYHSVGGFADLDVHEDVRFTAEVRGAGGRVVSTGRAPVLTSARLAGRTPAGMSSYLRRLVTAAAG